MTYHLEMQMATAAVTEAAALCVAVRAEMAGVNLLSKDDKSPVTVADFGSQALVCASLKVAFRNDPIVGEEDADALRRPENAALLNLVATYVGRHQPGANAASVLEWIDAGNAMPADRFWTLDPIDGTKGFLRNDQYAIALALIEGGDVKVAALACPALPVDIDNPHGQAGTLFVAVRGEGAFMGPLGGTRLQPIQVANAPHQLRFVESVETAHGDQTLQSAIAAACAITTPPLRMDSQAKYGAVACGAAALYLRLPSPKSPDYREKIWDHAAGALIVEEAGGRVTDMLGRNLDFTAGRQLENNRGIVASNGAIHAAVIEALAQD